MSRQPLAAADRDRIAQSLPFVESLARRVASTMPNSIDIGDLVQDGMLGLIDAARRFDEGRGIKFETFAERRVRGAMIDALRKDAWPRGVRRVRRELEAARESLRRELGVEPSMQDLATRVGTDVMRLERTIVRIHTIESTSPHASAESVEGASLPAVLMPSEPPAPDKAFETQEVKDRVRRAIGALPPRERKIVSMYYFGEATMKQIGTEIGVNESRVSQLHARALDRLKRLLAAETGMHEAATDAARAKLSMVPHGKAQGAERGIGAPRATEPGGVHPSTGLRVAPSEVEGQGSAPKMKMARAERPGSAQRLAGQSQKIA
ncbi:MAG: FliA/WhiG family RNA polymerase sigma factor [Vicinamibacterales bacterium]